MRIRSKRDLHDKYAITYSDWLAETVPIERTRFRIKVLRNHIKGLARHQVDALNYIEEQLDAAEQPENNATQDETAG